MIQAILLLGIGIFLSCDAYNNVLLLPSKPKPFTLSPFKTVRTLPSIYSISSSAPWTGDTHNINSMESLNSMKYSFSVLPPSFYHTAVKKESIKSIGFDIGCGAGKSTLEKSLAYPDVSWIGVDKMLDRYDLICPSKYASFKYPLQFWNLDFLTFSKSSVVWNMMEGKHVFLSFTNVLHELWDEEDNRQKMFSVLKRIGKCSRSCTVLIEDIYPTFTTPAISMFFDSFLETWEEGIDGGEYKLPFNFRILQNKYVPSPSYQPRCQYHRCCLTL
jgi:hypothetical protein